MTDRNHIHQQLKKLGVNMKGWGASEINELPAILMPDEQIKVLLRGWYENGFATLVATSDRLLLIDKKLFHLTIEDIRYDMIAEVDFNARITDASVRVNTINKTLVFTSFKARKLRELTSYVQERVMQLRRHIQWQQYEQTPVSSGASSTLQRPLHAIQELLPHQQQAMATPEGSAVASMAPLDHVQSSPNAINPSNFVKLSLTTKHNFLPKVPRRFRP